jgi:hypothetical protein
VNLKRFPFTFPAKTSSGADPLVKSHGISFYRTPKKAARNRRQIIYRFARQGTTKSGTQQNFIKVIRPKENEHSLHISDY